MYPGPPRGVVPRGRAPPRLPDGAWNGWWHTHHSGCPLPSAPVAPSSDPGGPLWARPCSRATPRSSSRAPPGQRPAALAAPTHGAGTWCPCGRRRRLGAVAATLARPDGALGRTPRLLALPVCRLTLFEGETAASRPHTVGVDWWGWVWDNDPARHPPPPPPKPRPRGDVTGGGSRGARPPPLGHRRIDPRLHQDLLHEVAQDARRLNGRWEQGQPPRTPAPPPPLPPAKGGPPPPPTVPPPPPGSRALGW